VANVFFSMRQSAPGLAALLLFPTRGLAAAR
jgi:hypothetical protein